MEGGSKNVHVILTRLKKNNDEDHELSPSIIKDEHVVSKDGAASEVVFTGLESNTVYGIRLRAEGNGGVGNDVVFTQTTLALASNVEPETQVLESSHEEQLVSQHVKADEEQPETKTPGETEMSDKKNIEEQEKESEQGAADTSSFPAEQATEAIADEEIINTESQTLINNHVNNYEINDGAPAPAKESSDPMNNTETDESKPPDTTSNEELHVNENTAGTPTPHLVDTTPTISSEIKESAVPTDLVASEEAEEASQFVGENANAKPTFEEQHETVLQNSEDETLENNTAVEVNSAAETASPEIQESVSEETAAVQKYEIRDLTTSLGKNQAQEVTVDDETKLSNQTEQEKQTARDSETSALPGEEQVECKNDENTPNDLKVEAASNPPETKTEPHAIVTASLEPVQNDEKMEEKKSMKENPESPSREVKPVLVIPAKEDVIDTAQTPKVNLSSPRQKHEVKITSPDSSGYASTPLMAKKETNSLALLAALTSTD